MKTRAEIESRFTEDYLLEQYHVANSSENWTEHKQRIETFKSVYRGDWIQKYKDGSSKRVTPIIENLAKNAIHDISGLANQAKSSIQFIQAKDTQDAYKTARVQEAAADTIWENNNSRRLERKLYMDIIGTGMALMAISKDSRSQYARIVRLNPELSYPNVRNGFIQDLTYVEKIKLNTAKRLYPDAFSGLMSFKDSDTVDLVEFYDDEEVVRYFVTGNTTMGHRATIVDNWRHELGCIPVAFVMADSFDDAFRGMFDQISGPLMARNEILQYMSDYIESMVHSPFEEKGILNPTDLPGPFTIYHHEPGEKESFMRRVAPAAPAGSVFGLVQYLESQASGEAVQPPARQGTVQQSIASGSFVNSTLGRLTTVVEELQELMADLRKQATYVAIEVERKYLDTKKPLIRPVGSQNTYTPSKTFDEYPFCIVQFGAMGGLTKLEADTRVLQHVGAKLTSKKLARENIDYQWDPTTEQDTIDMEDMQESFKQRIATDPNIPAGVIAKILMAQAEGKTLIEAIKDVAPELMGPPQPAEGQQGMLPGQAEGTPPAQEQQALQAGQVDLSKLFSPPPLEQSIIRNPT